MGRKDAKHLGLFISKELHYKLHYISKYEGRTASGQILHLLRQYIATFEEKNGEIEIPEEKD